MLDIFQDYLRYLYLDAMEVFSKISIVDVPYIFCRPLSDSIWVPGHLCSHDNPIKMMEGVEGILDAASRLLDVAELGHVPEPAFFSTLDKGPLCQVASLFVV